ncbi:MAG: DNA cytosine methyltransferase [Gammaproteobacteria bacterium]|nr:DNA cytosine methyltransferase [Gammaproteobacteria bacterium]
MKILNLYACLGGNRYKWDEVRDDLEITAVELDPEASRLYRERFPNDRVIVGDAHQYLLENYQEFDFIWTSPPCPTHSRVRMSQKNKDSFIPMYPDMKLYEEIIFLQHNFKGGFVVENVVPYYEPLIEAQKRGRHLYWASFNLPYNINERKSVNWARIKDEITAWSVFHDYDFRQYKGNQRTDKMARNLVDYQVGKVILETFLGIEPENIEQRMLF